MDGVLILNRSPGRDTRGGQSFCYAKFAKVKKPAYAKFAKVKKPAARGVPKWSPTPVLTAPDAA